MDPADFASLLEREPQQEGDLTIEDWMQKCEDAAKRNLTLRATIDSQAQRIKSLEDVLVAIRARTGAAKTMMQAVHVSAPARLEAIGHHVDAIISLIGETLDPCKPWCVLEPGHKGACEPVEEDRDAD